MPVTRRFLIAPPLARLIRDKYGWEQVVEGHFAPHADRQSQVRLQDGRAHLVLTRLDEDADSLEDKVELPLAHAEALLDTAPGKLIVERSLVQLGQHNAALARIVSPGSLDLVSVDFASAPDATSFKVPTWFGAEVTSDDDYLDRTIALAGLPAPAVAEVSNAGLEALLDIIEGDGIARRSTGGAVSAFLPHTSAFSLASDKRPAQSQNRTVVHRIDAEHEPTDDPLAGVIEGLSAALTDPAPETEARDTEPRRHQLLRATSH
jgi:CYTH domain-containing protein